MLGAIVYWTISGFKAERGEFRQKMAEIGLGAAVPKDPSVKRRLSKGLSVWQRQVGEGWGWRKIRGSKDVAIMRFRQDSGVVQAEHVYSVGLSFAMGGERQLVGNEGDGDSALQALRVCCDEAANYLDSAELSEVLASCMGGNGRSGLLGAVPLRPSGGVYFVAGPKLSQLQELRDFLAPKGVTIFQYLIDSQGENLGQAQGSVSIAITDELKELRNQILQLTGEDDDQRTVAAVERRKVALRSKVELWRDVLGELTDSMLTNLDAPRKAPQKRRDAMFVELAELLELPESESRDRALKARAGIQDAEVHMVGDTWFCDITDHPIFGSGSFIFPPGQLHRFREGVLYVDGADVDAYAGA